MLSGVMSRRRAQGLSLLQVKQTPDRPGYMDLFLAASPKEYLRSVRVDPTDRAARELLENGQPYPEPVFGMKDLLVSGKVVLPDTSSDPQGYTEQTFATAALHFGSRFLSFDKVGSKSGTHAEAMIVDDIATNWQQYLGTVDTETPADQPHAVLHLKTTRTPCAGCTARLRWLRMQAAQRGVRLKIEVDSMALHQAGRDGRGDPRSRRRAVRSRWRRGRPSVRWACGPWRDRASRCGCSTSTTPRSPFR